MHILHELWNGDFAPSDGSRPKAADYEAAARGFAEQERCLWETLTETQKQYYEAMQDARARTSWLELRQAFCRGARLGTLLMLDILAGEENGD